MTALQANLNPVANIVRMLLESAKFDFDGAVVQLACGAEHDDLIEDFKQILRDNKLDLTEIDDAFELENREYLFSIEFSTAYYAMQCNGNGSDPDFECDEWIDAQQFDGGVELCTYDISQLAVIAMLLGYGAHYDLASALKHVYKADLDWSMEMAAQEEAEHEEVLNEEAASRGMVRRQLDGSYK